jgi:hypothetical protein
MMSGLLEGRQALGKGAGRCRRDEPDLPIEPGVAVDRETIDLGKMTADPGDALASSSARISRDAGRPLSKPTLGRTTPAASSRYGRDSLAQR